MCQSHDNPVCHHLAYRFNLQREQHGTQLRVLKGGHNLAPGVAALSPAGSGSPPDLQ